MSAQSPSVVALIPARAGSKRITSKNVRLLAGHPLMAYSIAAALESRVFDAVIVSTDAAEYAEVARSYGADVPFLRPPELSGDLSPDFEWIRHTLQRLAEDGRSFECFSILRPTSPFRQASTIRRAWAEFLAEPKADSLRAVELCRQHPGKMWIVEGKRMKPLLPQDPSGTPTHSTPYQALPPVYTQNASLEIAWVRVVGETKTISGTAIVPFITEGYEGFDLNDELDWLVAADLVQSSRVSLPVISTRAPVPAGLHP